MTRSPRCCPSLVDGVDETNLAVERHVAGVPALPGRSGALPQALRSLELLRTRYVEPTPGLLGETLAALTDAAERSAVPHDRHGRRLAYAGAIGGTAVAAAPPTAACSSPGSAPVARGPACAELSRPTPGTRLGR